MPLALATVFAGVPDPRRATENTVRELTDILVVGTCPVIVGADGWERIAESGREDGFFRRFLERSRRSVQRRVAAASERERADESDVTAPSENRNGCRSR
ncbi:MAG: transposase family protein [Gemmata sp.]